MKFGRLIRMNKACFLACDQGLEHGPSDFNERNIDPEYIMNIAVEGGFSGIIVGHGIAEKYYRGAYKAVPLIVKLNGKTRLQRGDPLSRQLCSVDRAVKLGAAAVGYTIYPGSAHAQEMFAEFGRIVEQAHDHGIPVVLWVYPRGEGIDELDNKVLAYGARIGLELGADILKVKYNGDLENFKWMLKCAGRAKVVVSGGTKTEPAAFLKEVHDIVHVAGGTGVAVGRNIWQDQRPFSLAKALEQVVFHGKAPEDVMHLLH
ncbi:fructose-bisphosphate aldolase [Candidatus Woesearchaeota archaeon]|nr:MAG: fructose-bisphosphate aldolase [Candidatus Woesearchaeota archaeon]